MKISTNKTENKNRIAYRGMQNLQTTVMSSKVFSKLEILTHLETPSWSPRSEQRPLAKTWKNSVKIRLPQPARHRRGEFTRVAKKLSKNLSDRKFLWIRFRANLFLGDHWRGYEFRIEL